jgi:hypothetical protein
MKIVVTAVLMVVAMGIPAVGSAQTDTTKKPPPKQTLMERLEGEPHSPKRATIMSAIIPGLGQAYNKKYWKIGIIYAGAGALTYSFIYNTDSLDAYQRAYVTRIDSDTSNDNLFYPNLTDASVKNNRDFHRRARDLTIIGFVALYALNIIDANVDAHLKEFELNEDLSLKVEPQIRLQSAQPISLTLTLRF